MDDKTRLIERIGELILRDISQVAIINKFKINMASSSHPDKDLFDKMVRQGLSANRENAIGMVASGFKALTTDGKWREVAKWSLQYEDAETPSFRSF